jgi:mRNA interferase MazF
MVKQYETWMANLNPRVWTEAAKIRPVVIVQSDMLNSNHQSTMICPITSMLQPASHILRVHLWPDSGNGLEKKSDIMVDQIRTVDNNRLIKKIGVVNQTAADTLRENLKILLDL